jgi:hypothetical protein
MEKKFQELVEKKKVNLKEDESEVGTPSQNKNYTPSDEEAAHLDQILQGSPNLPFNPLDPNS